MSSSTENLVIKQPIRRLEIQISNFNVAIPHHVDLLKRHRNNIAKYQAQQDWEKVRKEHANVSRIVKQLKELLYQMDTLRAQVLDADINQFDKLTSNARFSITNAVKEYLELELPLPASRPSSPKSKEEEKEEEEDSGRPLDGRYARLQEEQEELQRQQTCLRAWNSLQDDIHGLHKLFVDFNKIVDDQKELANNAEDRIEEARENVNEGEKLLEKASRYKIVAYPIAGAVLGTCVGGPVGLIAGLKIGGLTALGCGILGFTGGSFLRKKELEMHKSQSKTETPLAETPAVKKSVSLPESLKQSKKDL